MFFAVSGGAFMLMGLWLFASFTRTGMAIPGFPLRIPWVLVILGVSIIVTVLLASLPAGELLYKFFYSSVLFVYAVLELFTGGYLTQYYDTIRSTFKKNLVDHIDNYSHDDEKLMDSIQFQFQCCGADGPEDWINSPSKQIPSSCCKIHFCDPTDPTEIHDVGCEFMIMYCLNLQLTVLAIVTILSALIPLCGGFLVLFNAYRTATQYMEIPRTSSQVKLNGCN
ncbi:hypothetical protein GE061_009416 [Apolygus lucorum]|uniref:Uncharacterized protein n=1 Tax=Apolygus lucorum TaxID=248454 RepID=A0A6A4J766_APOLU|nr:hypothetical protein GE061_009416 [Apolygus lucorum]